MIFKKMDKTATKRTVFNLALLLVGTLLLMGFLFVMQTQSARSKQRENSVEVLSGIEAALSRNESQIDSLKKQYHEVNMSKLKSLRRMFRYGEYKDILKQSKAEQEELLESAWEASDTALLVLIDEKGNVRVYSDKYDKYLGDGDNRNLVSMGLLKKDELESIIDNEESLSVEYSNGTYYYYCLPISVNGEESVDKLFLVMCEPAQILDVELSEIADLGKVLRDVTVGTTGFAFATDASDDTLIYYNDGKDDFSGDKITDHGLKEDILADGYEGTQRINGVKYYCVSKKCDYEYFGSNIVITTAEKESEVLEQRGKVLFFAATAFLAVSIFILSYAFILQRDAVIRGKSFKLKKIFSYKKNDYYINIRLLKALLPATLVGILLFFGVSLYSQTLLSLSRAINQSEASHEEIEQKLLANEDVRKAMTDYYEGQYLSKTLMAKYLLEETPSLAFSFNKDDFDVHQITTTENGVKKEVLDEYGNEIYSSSNSARLQEICDDNNFTSIYVFDDNGRVRATNNSDWYFQISQNEGDQSNEFWTIIDGKEPWYIQDVRISDTGEAMQFIGCSFMYYTMKNSDGSTAYIPAYRYQNHNTNDSEVKCHRGMVQIGISAKTITDILEVTSFKYVLSQMYVMDNGFIMAFDNDEAHTVLYGPKELMIDKSAAEVGFEPGDFASRYNGFKTIDGRKCFVIVREAADYYIATAIPTGSLYGVRNSIALASLIAGILVIIGILGMTIIMSESEWDAYYKMAENIAGNVYVTKAEGQTTDANIRHLSPEQKLARLLKVYVYILVICIWCYALVTGGDGSGLMSYILGFEWNHVPNTISFTACGIVLFTAIATVDLLSNIVIGLSRSLGARASTISNLFMACIKFVSIIFVIFFCLYLIGFDSRSLLTGAGLLSVVVGFGAQHLIADILSGIFIVLEGSFRVGDFVTIGDFRGEVREIGLRTTKIESDDFNVKIFNNSAISEIINMTKENSFASVVVEIPYDADVEKVEKIVRDSFPALRDKYRKIVADPIYRGITNFGSSGIEVNIWVPCFEKDRPQMERDVRKDIIILFNEHNINVPYSHFVSVPYEKSDII